MNAQLDSISIILTYKNKLLLLSPDIIVPNNVNIGTWGLIFGRKGSNESSEESAIRKIKYTTNLTINNVVLLSVQLNSVNDAFYHGKLTDADVNLMERRVGQRLEFYTFEELEKINLNPATNNFISQNNTLIQELLS